MQHAPPGDETRRSGSAGRWDLLAVLPLTGSRWSLTTSPVVWQALLARSRPHRVPGESRDHADGLCGGHPAARAGGHSVVGADRHHMPIARSRMPGAVPGRRRLHRRPRGGAVPSARAVQRCRSLCEHHLFTRSSLVPHLSHPSNTPINHARRLTTNITPYGKRDPASVLLFWRAAPAARPRTSHRPSHPRSAPHPRHRGDRPPTPTRYPEPAARPRPHGTASAAAGAAPVARPPRRSSSSCDLPAPSAARSASARSTAGSPAG